MGPVAADPSWPETCDQDQLEPVLRQEAIRSGADVHFHTEPVNVTQAHVSMRLVPPVGFEPTLDAV